VLNAATQSGHHGVAAGELITLTGIGIGPDTGVANVPDSQGQIPRELAGVHVLLDAAVPVELAGKANTSIVVKLQRPPVRAAFGAGGLWQPGIFRWRIGESDQAVAINQDNTPNSPVQPAARGSVVAIYTTGYGPTAPACTTGGLNIPQSTGLAAGITAQIFDGRTRCDLRRQRS
jgi:uncharacterized protein (TIGR03437 family)